MFFFVALIAFILWLVILFLAARYFGQRYFHEPQRADVAALAVTAAFAVGSLWQLAVHAANPGTSVATTAVPPAPVATAAAPVAVGPPKDVSAVCRSAKDPAGDKPMANLNGSLDPVSSTEKPAENIQDGGRMDHLQHYRAQGWAVAPSGDRLASGVCLYVDGKLDRRSRVLYGFSRPDVANAFHQPAVTAAGFEIDIPTDLLPPGTHRIQIATVSKPEGVAVLRDVRSITVY